MLVTRVQLDVDKVSLENRLIKCIDHQTIVDRLSYYIKMEVTQFRMLGYDKFNWKYL